ncbi:MAG: MbnP family protein [Chitinophagaceae bacterium]|nr:MbnP family protein [Chitinophagaceae bacterium]
MLNTFSIRPILLASLLIMLSFSFIKKEVDQVDTATVTIQFVTKVGEVEMVPMKSYTNSSFEDFAVSKFKYYVSNFQMNGTGFTRAKGDTYFLIDEDDARTKKIEIKIEPGNYRAIRFLLGVDSLRNVSGAQTGALDPLHGMFWTWNTGYIMAKLEGHSSASRRPFNMFEYHIGGFSGINNTLKWINLDLTQPVSLKRNDHLHIKIGVNLLEWFAGPADISIEEKSSITSPGANAKRIADNYADMFTLVEAKPNEP